MKPIVLTPESRKKAIIPCNVARMKHNCDRSRDELLKPVPAILICLLLSACSPPCWTGSEMNKRTDCNMIEQILAAIP